MKIQTAILIAATCFAAGNICLANYNDDLQTLSGNPFLPAAGEMPGAYQNRVNQYRARQKMVGDLQSSRATLNSLNVQAKKLELQIRAGMLIPDDKGATNTAPTTLTDEQKGAMLKDLLKIQEKIVWMNSVVRDLAEQLADDDARIETENVRQEIRDAQFQQTQELRRELRDRRDCR